MLVDANFLSRPVSSTEVFAEDTFAVHAHRLKKGVGTIFGDRFYSNGNVLAIDDEIYEKLTVWVPSDVPMQPLSLELGDGSNAVVVYTRGGSAWPHHACAGLLQSGQLTVEPVHRVLFGTRWHVHVTGSLRLRNTDLGSQACPTTLDRQFEGAPIEYGSLTPWLGSMSDQPYRETYR
jgi:hypothetical protein